MRLIGIINDKNQAKVFGDYIYSLGMEYKLEPAESQGWEIWVESEDQLERAKNLLDEFRSNPNDAKYHQAGGVAIQIRTQKKEEEKQFRKRFFQKDQIFSLGVPYLTLFLIGISVGVTLVTGFGKNDSILNYLYITRVQVMGNYVQWHPGLTEVMNGQVWRLVTPIFIHFGILHILFNMWWLKDLGGMIEQHQKAWYLGLLVLVIGVVSNVGQYYVGGPMFGGMSGVVYGLLGYIWLRGRYDPMSGYFMHPQIVWMMVIWFFLCLFHIIPNVANTAHGVGFAIGCGWGYLAAILHPGHSN